MKTLLKVEHLKKYFKTAGGMLHAVDDISFELNEGSILGVVGESGCGKSTLGRTLLHLTEPTSGKIIFDGKDVTNLTGRALKDLRKEMQLIFQDPFASLNPRMTVRDIIEEPLKIYRLYPAKERKEYVDDLMKTVGIAPRISDCYPHELDGGRRQRVGIARALALNPRFLVCDEPVSALDVSIQAQILNLMVELQREKNLTYMFVTHDLSVVKHISDKIMVMYLGQMIEYADTKALFTRQYHPYTKALLSAVPIPKVPVNKERIILQGEVSSPIDPEPGCRFAKRCRYAKEQCFDSSPEAKEVEPGRLVKCHFAGKLDLS